MSLKSFFFFGLAFDSGLELICDAPGKKYPIHLCPLLIRCGGRWWRKKKKKKKTKKKKNERRKRWRSSSNSYQGNKANSTDRYCFAAYKETNKETKIE